MSAGNSAGRGEVVACAHIYAAANPNVCLLCDQPRPAAEGVREALAKALNASSWVACIWQVQVALAALADQPATHLTLHRDQEPEPDCLLVDQPASDYRCEHCGRLRSSAESNGSTSCAPPCIVQPHAFTGNHPADVAASDAPERGR